MSMRTFVSFIKIHVLLKISVLKKLYFTTNFQLITNVAKNSILFVASILNVHSDILVQCILVAFVGADYNRL